MSYQHIFDSHAHYDDAAFDQDREAVLAALPEKGVCGVLNCGASMAGSRAAVALAARWPFVHAAVGLHPEELRHAAPDWQAELAALLPQRAQRRIVAVGEIGLDYHYPDNAPREAQLAAFAAQLALARDFDLPVIVHDRDAHADTLALLQKYRPRGVVHSFSGSVEMAREVLALGMYIGLGGAVTFKNAKKPLRVAAAVPADRLLNETDCPYSAPVPYRGQRCDSSMIPLAAQAIAAVRGESVQQVLDHGAENARRLFSL